MAYPASKLSAAPIREDTSIDCSGIIRCRCDPMDLPPLLSGRASRGVVLAALLLMLCSLVPAHRLAEATGSRISSSRALASPAADPVVDGAYVQAQLAYLVTRDPRREAGEDTDLPRVRNGHDALAADWLGAPRS